MIKCLPCAEAISASVSFCPVRVVASGTTLYLYSAAFESMSADGEVMWCLAGKLGENPSQTAHMLRFTTVSKITV